MSALIETREREEAASRHDPMDRWLAVSEPLAIDDDRTGKTRTRNAGRYESGV
jgi:hypothetical protein